MLGTGWPGWCLKHITAIKTLSNAPLLAWAQELLAQTVEIDLFMRQRTAVHVPRIRR